MISPCFVVSDVCTVGFLWLCNSSWAEFAYGHKGQQGLVVVAEVLSLAELGNGSPILFNAWHSTLMLLLAALQYCVLKWLIMRLTQVPDWPAWESEDHNITDIGDSSTGVIYGATNTLGRVHPGSATLTKTCCSTHSQFPSKYCLESEFWPSSNNSDKFCGSQ